MQSKWKNKVPMNSTQALQCRRLLQYLNSEENLAKNEKTKTNIKLLSTSDLAVARKILLEIDPIERTKEHLDLTKALHVVYTSGTFSGKASDEEIYWSYLMWGMCRFGAARDALPELYQKWDLPSYTNIIAEDGGVLQEVVKGLALEGCEEELVELIEFALSKDVPYTTWMQETITIFFAQRDRIPETQYWFTKMLSNEQCRPTVYQSVASFAMRNKLQEWAMPFFLELGQSQPRKIFWDVLLQAMLLIGMRLQEVQAMMSHMVCQKGPLTPDIETINSLLQVAEEKADTDLAKDIIAIAEDMKIRPNEGTYLILLGLHLKTGSVANSQAAYEGLQDAGSISPTAEAKVWNQYAQLMNKYLLLLNSQIPPDFELILKLLDAVEEEQIHLYPETVAALCLRFLENDQNFDVMDILSLHAFRYSETQREIVQSAFLSFCLDTNTSTSRAWGAYQLLQQFFQDLSLDRRVQLLQAFFDRKRPDMATYVFGHMRQHRNKAYQPTLDVYVQCLEGFANNPDREGTEMVHNMLKMDTRIQPNTRLYTALMLAFTGCDRPLRAMDFWNDIKGSREGPSYATLEAVFWTLERRSGGDKQAREIWERIESMDLEVPSAVYNAYVGAIAAGGLANEVELRGLIMKMATFVGTEPEAMT